MAEKIAVVTGGSLGLGRETARLLLDQGYRVAIFGRSQASLDDAVADLGRGVVAVSVDVSDDASVVAGFAKVDAALGPVDTLINSAAIFRPFLVEKASASDVMAMVNTNFCGQIYCAREAIARMRPRGGGDIINVSSESVRQSTPCFVVYAATKAAVESFTKQMGEELREDGIRCTTFRVGRMLSPGAANASFPPGLLERYIERSQTTGAGYWTGVGMAPASAAQVLVNILRTPRDARQEFVELRSA